MMEKAGFQSAAPSSPSSPAVLSSHEEGNNRQPGKTLEQLRGETYPLQPPAATSAVLSSSPRARSIEPHNPQLTSREEGWRHKATRSGSTFSHISPATRLGLIIAGVCIGTGALILVTLLVMTQSPAHPTSIKLSSIHQKKQSFVQATEVPQSSRVSRPTIPNVAPTPTAPGSAYIDNVQIGSSLNTNPVEIAWQTRDFQLGQKIYITMNVHSIGYRGSICLDWYVQNMFLTHYSFPAIGDPSLPHSSAWSYAISMRQGAGYVDVFWATSLACTDKILAQRVDFNVTG